MTRSVPDPLHGRAKPGACRVLFAPLGGLGRDRAQTKAWMLTFTDLIALMLAFFVLLFAMSQIEQRKWQALADSLATGQNAVHKVTTRTPAIEFQIKGEEVIPGTDLDYLAPVLRQQIAAQAILSRSIVRRLPDRLVISLPGDLLYAAKTTAPSAQAADVVFAIGGVLRHLSNTIEVEAHTDPSPPAGGIASNWELALARAVLVTGMLTEAGYRGPVLARGYGAAQYHRLSPALSAAERRALGNRIDVVIRERVQEVQ